MSFHDLPPNLRDVPLDTPTLIADVLDLFVSMQARYDGSMVVLLCDEQRRIVQPIQIDDLEVSPPPDAGVMLANLVTAVTGVHPDASMLVGVARPGRLRVFPCDERWARALQRACDDRVQLLGVHLVTPSGSLPIAV